MMTEHGFDIEAMLGLFELGIATQNDATLSPDEQEAVMAEIEVLEAKNAQLLAALEATQDAAKMAAFAVDIRTQLNPSKAVEYFNKMFPEVAKALAAAKGGE